MTKNHGNNRDQNRGIWQLVIKMTLFKTDLSQEALNRYHEKWSALRVKKGAPAPVARRGRPMDQHVAM